MAPASVAACRSVLAFENYDWYEGMGQEDTDHFTSMAWTNDKGSCYFGIRPADAGDIAKYKEFVIGGTDLRDLLSTLAGFAEDDTTSTVTRSGTMHCNVHDDKGIYKDASYNIRWGVYNCTELDAKGN
ncbi:Uu.00g097490.m01.CDS01 [Anthostomella pinea]|uniref:Uu.00g097490.m01.CDS01 n=1 Tax=Anthostomella pinea TaxID=933095 RepID=A0AAI8VCD6_9PEZI|nr:Uu.00g097490.m01.CDS01 [Anthostomella pinea]